MNLERYWDLLELLSVATRDEIDLVTTINDYDEKTLNLILWARTGYRNIRQYIESELPEEADDLLEGLND